MALPGNVTYGWVTGLYEDVDGTLATGTVTFTPSVTAWLDTTASPPVTIVPKVRVATVTAGTFVQQLVATDDTALNPSGWTYTVTFDLHFGTTATALQSFSINVPTGGSSGAPNVNLTTSTPVPDSNGTYYLGGGGGSSATAIHAAPAKTTPADADEMGYLNSAASYTDVKWTWANLKSALTALFVPTTRTVNGHALSSNVTVSASDVGLGSVNNTADTAKPVSTAQQAALDLKQDANTLGDDVIAALPGSTRIVAYAGGWPSLTDYTDATQRWVFIGPSSPAAPTVAAPANAAFHLLTS